MVFVFGVVTVLVIDPKYKYATIQRVEKRSFRRNKMDDRV